MYFKPNKKEWIGGRLATRHDRHRYCKKKFQGAKCELVRFLDWRPINCFCLPQFTETSVFAQGVRVQI